MNPPTPAAIPGNVALASEWVKIVVGILTALGFYTQYRRANEQRAIENEQRNLGNKQREEERSRNHVNTARQILDTLFSDIKSRDALRMLDWKARKYVLPNGAVETISEHDVANGVRVKAQRPFPAQDDLANQEKNEGLDVIMSFNDGEQYVRDCFERLYDQFDSMEHFIQRGLLDFADLKPPLAYYAEIIKASGGQTEFLQEYGYHLTQIFLKRF